MDLDFEIDTSWVELAAGKRWSSTGSVTLPATLAVDSRWEDDGREEVSIVESDKSSMYDAVLSYESTAHSDISLSTLHEPAINFCASREARSEPLLRCLWVSDLTFNDVVLKGTHRDGKLLINSAARTILRGLLKEYELLYASSKASSELRRRLMGPGRVSDLTFDDGVLKRRDQDGRPWAEPPLFDYDRFNKDFVPSDKMILEMFPTDPVARTTYRDTQTEYELLNMFSDWSCKRVDTNIVRCGSVDFHSTLIDELMIDQKVVGEEFDVVKQSLTDLQTWQKAHMDMDGELLIVAGFELSRGKDLFFGPGGDQAFVLYANKLPTFHGPLWPLKHDLKTWEWFQLEEDGCGTEKTKFNLAKNENLFDASYFGGVEARAKWGYLNWEKRHGSLDLERKLEQGQNFLGIAVDMFDGPEWEREAARVRWNDLVRRDLQAPKDDIETWERFHLDADGSGTKEIKQKLAEGKDIFDTSYFGGAAARSKWGYLSWQNKKEPLEDILSQGLSFSGLEDCMGETEKEWEKESALARFKKLISSKMDPPKHDLTTWERFQLDLDGVGTNGIREALLNGKDVFGEAYFGGIESRAKWGYVLWETFCLGSDKSTTCAERWLRHAGRDIFSACSAGECWHRQLPDWAWESGRSKYAYLLENLPRFPVHDLETWEWFHINKKGGAAKSYDNGWYSPELFRKCHFGGLQARAKWGYLEWETRWVDRYGNTICAEKALHDGRDIFIPDDRREPWAEDSARAKYGYLTHNGYLLEYVPREPKHDLDTWEWFQCRDGDLAGIKAKLKDGKKLFDGHYYGGIQARAKYGFLASEEMKMTWSENDIRSSASQNDTVFAWLHRQPNLTEDLSFLFSDIWNWTSKPDLTQVFEILFAEEDMLQKQVHKTKPFIPSKPSWLKDAPPQKLKRSPPAQKCKPPKPTWLRDMPPRKRENNPSAQKLKPPKPAWLSGILRSKLDADPPAKKCKPPKPARLNGIMRGKLEASPSAQKH